MVSEEKPIKERPIMEKIILSIVVLLTTVIAGCLTQEPLIGGERDEHGCLGPAGYSWDEDIGACVRGWEIDNEGKRKAATISVEFIGEGYGLTIVGFEVMRCPGCYSVFLSKSDNTRINVNLEDWEVVGTEKHYPADDADNEGTIYSFEDCIAAGYPAMESYPRQCRTPGGKHFVEEIDTPIPEPEPIPHPPLTKEICEEGKGRWNECGSRCQIDYAGKEEPIACTLQCEQICECGGFQGLPCPNGYVCQMPSGYDMLGYCVLNPQQMPMDVARALAIASKSECTKEGKLTKDITYNEYTKTWWIDLDLEKPGCNPACVVDEKTQTAEINWRCTGVIPPTDNCELDPDPGRCKAYMPRFYFDETEGKCKEFIWGGCGGTVPFESLDECQRTCDIKRIGRYCESDEDCVCLSGCACGCYNKDYKSPQTLIACACDAYCLVLEDYQCVCEDNICQETLKETEKHYCSDDQRGIVACTMDYRPVCGVEGDGTENTYGNGCTAC
ncbi:MAG: BPTI/Kunitz domain-containing protein, partial [Candidatus Altiarchaeota archaeon]